MTTMGIRLRMTNLDVLFERLREEGWYCGWAHMCCSNCAWMDVPTYHEEGPFKGEEVDLDKCLFNHEQDCEDEDAYEDMDEDAYEEMLDEQDGACFITLSPDQLGESCFNFSPNKTGVANLKAILPIIEECGCTYNWNGKGDTTISINWEK